MIQRDALGRLIGDRPSEAQEELERVRTDRPDVEAVRSARAQEASEALSRVTLLEARHLVKGDSVAWTGESHLVVIADHERALVYDVVGGEVGRDVVRLTLAGPQGNVVHATVGSSEDFRILESS